MARENPIYTTTIECPICKTQNAFQAVRVGAYTEEDRESDFRPTGRVWRNPEFNGLNPLAYSMATCSSCLYTRELDGKYKNWQRDVAFKMYRQKSLREAHLMAFSEEEGVVRILGSHIDVNRWPRETAVNQLLLGVFDEQLLDTRDTLNIARFYLRIAWLYREQGDPDGGQSDRSANVQVAQVRLSDHLRRWQEMQKQLEHFCSTMESACHQSGDSARELAEVSERMESMFANWKTRLTNLPDAPETPENVDQPYFGHSSHYAFLRLLRPRWNEVPLNEMEAMQFALKYYLEYYQNSRSFPNPEQELQTTYLIGELARRTHQTHVANNYFNHAIRTGQRLVHQFQKDPQRVTYIRKLLEMAFEQGKKNRAATEVAASGS